VVFAGFTVDFDTDVDVATMTLAGRRGQRRFNGLENDGLFNAFFVGHRVNDVEHFFTHVAYSPPKRPQAPDTLFKSKSKTRLARSMSTNGN